MTARTSVHLWCDHPDCNDSDAYNPVYSYTSARSVRADAKHDGWTHRNGKDFCPDHSTGGKS